MVCYNVIKNFFVSLEISDGSYNPSQNNLSLINEFEKFRTFMKSLIAECIQFSCAIANFFISAKETVH